MFSSLPCPSIQETTRGLFLGLLVSWSVAGCADEPPQETRAAPPVAIATPLLAPAERPSVGAVDSFGNLKGGELVVYGFELPVNSVRNPRAMAFPVFYVEANHRRLLRFYRSRGHTLIKNVAGWRIEHSDRTLERDPQGLAPFADAIVIVSQGPGSGHTLRFHRASPSPPPKRALELLVEAEQSANAQGAAGGQEPKTVQAKLKRLRSAAFKERPSTAKATDLSQRIYQHMKRQGSTRFRD